MPVFIYGRPRGRRVVWAVEMRGVEKSFGPLRVLDGVDLRVPRGGVFGFLGRNGAGKTTTLHILLGLLAPDGGTASVAGVDVVRDPHAVRSRSGVLLEHHGLYERLDAVENLALAGGLHGMRRPEALERAGQVLESLGLWDRRRDKVGTWSKGMKQRLAIARALLHRPDVAFLDEPTNGFDPVAARDLRSQLRNLARQEGTTFFLTTHNMDEAQRTCDLVAVLRKGRIAAQGPPSALVARRPRVRIRAEGVDARAVSAVRGLDGMVAVARQDGHIVVEMEDAGLVPDVVAALAKRGIRIHEVTSDRVDLQDAFLEIMEGA